MRLTWLERREVVRLLAVKGKYDGEVVRLLQPVQASAGTEVIITFLDEAAESWIHRLPSQIKASSLSQIQQLLSTIKTSLAEAVIEGREERV
jgi:hypothetical protein